MTIKKYKINLDGNTIGTIDLRLEQYFNQDTRNIEREQVAEHHGIATTWGLRLVPIQSKFIISTDMNTGITKRIYTE